MMMLTTLKQKIDRMDARLSSTRSGQNQDTTEDSLAVALEKLLWPSSTQQALKASQDSWSLIEKNFFLVPKSIVMGFSGFACPRCLSVEPPLPIKELGCDLTAVTRHHCSSENIQTPERPRIPDLALALKQQKQFSAEMVMSYVDRWSDGTKQIFAKKISPKLENGISIEDYLRKDYRVPYRYYIAEPLTVDRFPWLIKLLENGHVTPTRAEIRDFCTWCNGTYAIVPVSRENITNYYNMILIRDCSKDITSYLEKMVLT